MGGGMGLIVIAEIYDVPYRPDPQGGRSVAGFAGRGDSADCSSPPGTRGTPLVPGRAYQDETRERPRRPNWTSGARGFRYAIGGPRPGGGSCSGRGG